MKCQFCKRTPAILDCKYCEKNFCSRCIQLELHACENMSDKKNELLDKLKTTLTVLKVSKL